MLAYLLFAAALVRTSTATCKKKEKGLSVRQMKDTKDAWENCPGECAKIGDGWVHNGHWWHDQENFDMSVCHCVKPCPEEPVCTPQSPCDLGDDGCSPARPCDEFQGHCDGNADCAGDLVCLADGGDINFCQPKPPCQREEKGLSVKQLKNTNDAWDKCPGYCKRIGDGWAHNGHWWHDQENKGKSVCHCVKECPVYPECAVGELPLESTRKCSIQGYTCTATDGPECCNGRVEEKRKCIPCDETRLRRDIDQVYKTADSCEVYRCPRGLFDVVRMCEERGEWCDADDKADENGCLACSQCKEEDRAQKCPECQNVPFFYTAYNTKAHCEDVRHKRLCKKMGDDCVWVGTGRKGTCVHHDSIPDYHCTLLTHKMTCLQFDSCGWIGRRGCIDFTPADCKYYRHNQEKCDKRKECEFDADAPKRDRCRASK